MFPFLKINSSNIMFNADSQIAKTLKCEQCKHKIDIDEHRICGNIVLPCPECVKESTIFNLASPKEELLEKESGMMVSQSKEMHEAEIIRLDIIENILTLHCPRCRLAFLDYRGNAALKCHNCKAGFCALCLKDCDKNARDHVMVCPENVCAEKRPNLLYVRYATFKEHHRKRQQDIINEKMRNLPAEIRGLLTKIIKKELDDLEIGLE